MSEDSYVQLMDLQTKKVLHFLNGSHKGSVRNAAVDPQLEFLVTTGCDGYLHINKIEDQICLKKIKIATKPCLNFTPNNFSLVWSPDG